VQHELQIVTVERWLLARIADSALLAHQVLESPIARRSAILANSTEVSAL